MENVVVVKDLSVSFGGPNGQTPAVIDANLQVARQESVGIVGESGSGKSTLALALLGLQPDSAHVTGTVEVAGIPMLAGNKVARRARGTKVGLILQDPTPSLNPLRTVGSQIREACKLDGASKDEARKRSIDVLNSVGLDGAEVVKKRPFELSGGMNQRVVIAMALAQSPEVLVADEPTTALDVTTQAAIIRLLEQVRHEWGMSLVMVSHDLAVIYQVTDRIVVMYAGRIVEEGRTEAVVNGPRHPYTKALLASLPDVNDTPERLKTIPGTLEPGMVSTQGCPFEPRCEVSLPQCVTEFPGPDTIEGHSTAWCWALEEEKNESASREVG